MIFFYFDSQMIFQDWWHNTPYGFAGKHDFTVLTGKCGFTVQAENVFLRFGEKMQLYYFGGKMQFRDFDGKHTILGFDRKTWFSDFYKTIQFLIQNII